MKTSTSLLVTFVLSLILSTASAQLITEIIEIPLEKAIKDPELVHAMYQQLDDSFLLAEWAKKEYTATVYFNLFEHKIVGTYDEWVSFFLMDIIIKKVKKNPAYSQP